MKIKLGKKIISKNSPTYFIADIAANHDGSLSRAKKLIKLCAKSGANAAKFQHFKAETIVLDEGFKKIGKISHQKKWKESVFKVYKKASINPKWTKVLSEECKKYKIDFLTAPYDLNYVDQVNKYIPAYKIGSGDITWKEIIIKIAKKNKPVLLACGASTLEETIDAVRLILKYNKKVILMQCNTNYTNEQSNINYINLNVIKQFKKIFKKKVILGLSDHTKGHATVLGSITLGAKVIEKHFTLNKKQYGPDHKASIDAEELKNMVKMIRNIEKSLGSKNKIITTSEKRNIPTVRKSIVSRKKIKKGEIFNLSNIAIKRPGSGISPMKWYKVLGKIAKKNFKEGELIKL